MHSIHPGVVELPPLYLVRASHRELPMGKLSGCHNQWCWDSSRVLFHCHILLVRFHEKEGKMSPFSLLLSVHSNYIGDRIFFYMHKSSVF